MITKTKAKGVLIYLQYLIYLNYIYFIFYEDLKGILIVFFTHYHLVPYTPLSPCSHHTVVHVHESFLLFARSIHP